MPLCLRISLFCILTHYLKQFYHYIHDIFHYFYFMHDFGLIIFYFFDFIPQNTAFIINLFIAFYAGFYSRNPLISLIRDKIVLQLQLITPGSVSITVCRKCSISSLDEATACTCSLSLPVTR